MNSSMGSDPMEMIEYEVGGRVSNQLQDRIDYLVVCVNDFADAHGMSYVQGYDYLKRHSGIAYIINNYDIEHAYPIEETIANLVQVCRRNGGEEV